MIGRLAHLWPFRRAARAPGGADWRLKNAIRMVGKLARENEQLRATVARLERQQAPALDCRGVMAEAADELRMTVQGWRVLHGRHRDHGHG